MPALDGEFLLFGVAVAATPEMGAAGQADADALVAAMSPWANGRQYLNFLEASVDPRTGYDEASYARLQELRAAMDPDGMVLANHYIAEPVSLPTQR